MPLMFNSILREAGIPLEDVRLLRHKDQRAKKGRGIYQLWRDDRPQFEAYQSTQGFSGRKKLQLPYWASFVGTPATTWPEERDEGSELFDMAGKQF